MLFPTSRLKFTRTFQGKATVDGWLVMEMTGVDIDGVSRIYIPVEEIERLKQGGDKGAERLNALRGLLQTDDENT